MIAVKGGKCSGKLQPAHPFFEIEMNEAIQFLNKIFGYDAPVPDAPATYSHRLGVLESWCRRKEEEKKQAAIRERRKLAPGELTKAQKRILMIVNCNQGVTAVDVAKKTGWCRNHCSISMTDLWRKKLINREMRKGGQSRWYVYTKKEQQL